jgi:hypothetical protein
MLCCIFQSLACIWASISTRYLLRNPENEKLTFGFNPGPGGRHAFPGLLARGCSMKTLLIDLASAAVVAAIVCAPFALYFAFVMGA